jgi:hypothetical protein
MAQTISVVRGTVNFVGNGSTYGTLFTNASTGIATRVITNYYSANMGNSSSNFHYSNLEVYTPSTSGFALIGFHSLTNASTSTTGTVNFLPQNTITNQVTNQATGSAKNVYTGIYLQNGTIPEGYVPSSSNQRGSYMPSNFWIGPSDVVRAKGISYYVSGKSQLTGNITINYSFTLITES